jgi:hypothetical protein
MLDVFEFPSPQQSDYQEFYGGGSTRDWVKPRGVSMVRFMLIGAGGGGGASSGSAGTAGGGSGAVTSWIGPAIFVPDILRITVGAGALGANGTASSVIYQAKDGTGYTLLTANGGEAGVSQSTNPGAGAIASTNNYFGAAGIFSSIAGQVAAGGAVGGGGGSITPSSTTFLSGGAGGSGGAIGIGGSVTPNYGYVALPPAAAGGTVKGADGYFIIQPILVGCGGAGGTTSESSGTVGGKGGIGCGGGGAGENASLAGAGGDGAVFVWAW